MGSNWFVRVFDAMKSSIAEDFLLEKIDVRGAKASRRSVRSNEEYVTVTVRSSRIENSRKWATKIYGCLQSKAEYLHGRGRQECNTVIVPDMMKALDPAHLDRVIQVNRRVLGPVPYRGELSLQLGLFCVKGSDLVEPYIDLLTTISRAAGVAFVSQMTPFIEPLRKGADLLLSVPDHAQLEIGIDREWSDLETGDWIMMRVPKGTGDTTTLCLDPNDFKLITQAGRPVLAYPYVVFAIDASPERADWFLNPQLRDAWDAIAEAASKQQADLAEQRLKHFEALCRWSDDLVPVDQQRLVKLARDKLPELQKGTTISVHRNTTPNPLGRLEDLRLYGQ